MCSSNISALMVSMIGHRRNISIATIASFVVLGTFGSLAYALNLFFITMLYAPLARHRVESHQQNALFTPKAVVYSLPIVGSLLLIYLAPLFMMRNSDVTLLRFGYVAFPLYLAFAPQVGLQLMNLIRSLRYPDNSSELGTRTCFEAGRPSIFQHRILDLKHRILCLTLGASQCKLLRQHAVGTYRGIRPPDQCC